MRWKSACCIRLWLVMPMSMSLWGPNGLPLTKDWPVTELPRTYTVALRSSSA